MRDFKLLERWRWRSCAFAAGIAVAIGVPSAAPAQGSVDFFSFFFGGGSDVQKPPAIRRPIRTRHRAARVASHRQSSDQQISKVRPVSKVRYAAKHQAEHRQYQESYKISGPAYCVRLCDGRYFQLAISTPDTASALCGRACPNSAVKVFFGDGAIGDTETADGQRYDALPNAFMYRTRLVADCSCRNDGPGLAAVNIEQDPTLEQGDIVMSREGPIVFQGEGDKKQRLTFTPITNYREIESEVRRYLATLPVDTDR